MQSPISDLRALRDTVARIERSGEQPATVRNCRLVPLSDTPLALDMALGGGMRKGTLHEVTAQMPRDAAAAAGFAAALAARCLSDGSLIWIVDDRAAWETGLPYRQGLVAHGLDPDKLLLVRTRDAATTLWAAEEALRAGAGIVLIELWRGQSYDLAASKRLLMAARRQGGLSLVLHVGLDPAAVSSAADTRFAVAARPGSYPVSLPGRLPIPGPPTFAVRLLKRRDAGNGYDRDRVHCLVWHRGLRSFAEADDHRSADPLTDARPPSSPAGEGEPRRRRETDEGSARLQRTSYDSASVAVPHLFALTEDGRAVFKEGRRP